VEARHWQWLVWGGRVLVVAAPLAVVGCRLTHSEWASAPADAGGLPGHWIPNVALALSFVWALTLPFLVLPITPLSLLEIERGELRGPTVLGTRRVRMAKLQRFRGWYAPGRFTHSLAYVLRDDGHGWLIAWDSDVERYNPAPSQLEGQVDRARSRRVTIRERVASWVVVIAWGLCAFLILALGFSLALG